MTGNALGVCCVLTLLKLSVMANEIDHKCERIETYNDQTMQIVLRDVSISYMGRCRYFRCPKYTMVKKTFYEMVPVVRTRTVEECCDGYTPNVWTNLCEAHCDLDCGPKGFCAAPQTCSCIQDYEWDADGRKCNPACREGCSNGNCVEPDVCECLAGYTQTSHNACVPNCTNCTNGHCSLPETCVCNEGFARNESAESCDPICPNGCDHGICVSPNQCQCFAGYTLNAENRCVPHCTNCLNGECTAPETCSCHTGFVQHNRTDGQCRPVCSPECVHGICVAPNKCECEKGYTLDETSTNNCIPLCSNCGNGVCTAPEKCNCHEGFVWDNDTRQCMPHCHAGCFSNNCNTGVGNTKCDFLEEMTFQLIQMDRRSYVQSCTHCANGLCSAPNICSCNVGFSWNNATSQCSPVCRSGCSNGKCIAPDTCECNAGFEAVDGNSVCAPICYNQCHHRDGKCTTLDICAKCFDRHHFKNAIINICEPRCLVPCGTNRCTLSPYKCDEKIEFTTTVPLVTTNHINIAIDCHENYCVPKHCSTDDEQPTGTGHHCVCSEGYRVVNQTHCAPFCRTGCVNAICRSPNICECRNGYERNSNNDLESSHICHPLCGEKIGCSMGTCVAPNVCDCNAGYVRDDADPFGCVLDIKPTQSSLERNDINHSVLAFAALAGLLILICCGIAIFGYVRRIRRSSVHYKVDEQSYIYKNGDSDIE